MVNKLIVLLRSPYPMLCKRWKSVVFSSIIVFLILFFLEPFGISRLGAQKFWVVLGYAGVSALALIIFVYVLPMLFRQYYKDWTFGKNFLNTALLWITIAVGNCFYSLFLFHSALSWEVFNTFLFWVVLLGPIPAVFFMMWNRNLLLARNLKEAMEINLYLAKNLDKRELTLDYTDIQEKNRQGRKLQDSCAIVEKSNVGELNVGSSKVETDQVKVVAINQGCNTVGGNVTKEGANTEGLIDGNRRKKSTDEDTTILSEVTVLSFSGVTKEKLEVRSDELLYVEADGNYVKVVYRKEGKERRKLLRVTMKQAEDAVRDCPYIVRCHRAFLVNIRLIMKVNGNSQGYRLNLRDCEEDIPVSRAYTSDVKYLIEHSEEG